MMESPEGRGRILKPKIVKVAFVECLGGLNVVGVPGFL